MELQDLLLRNSSGYYLTVPKVHRATTSSIPLKAYEDLKAFKLFLADVGLLGCMVRLNQTALLNGNELFKEFKGR